MSRYGVFSALALLAVCSIFASAQSTAASAADHPTGPPQFVTFPILTHVSASGLDHGHFVFTDGAAIPAPLNSDRGAANYNPALFGGPKAAAITGSGEANASNAPDSYEGETGAASNGSTLVGGSNHIYPGNCSASAASGSFGDCAPYAYASTDGLAFTKTALPRTWNGVTLGIGFDPAVDFDKTGTFFYSYGVAPLSGNYPNGIVVVNSANGVNWTQSTPVTFNTNRFFDDKYYLAIDRSNTGFANRIYVSWDRNSANNQILYIAYSSNGGASWSAPIKVNDGASKFERVIGAYPAVDQNTGVVYDSWHDYARDIIYVDHSTNGGANWGTDVAAAQTHTGFGLNIGCVGGRSQGPAHALKVGPSGALYLVYADKVSGRGFNRGFDILLTKSTNGGATWSAPVTLNDDSGAADQFHPTLSVTSNGLGGDQVTVSFFDRRDDPSNCAAYVYATQSSDSGATWSANARVTSASGSFDGNPNGPGDYSSSTPFLSGTNPFQCDHRASNPETSTAGGFDVYTEHLQ